MRLDESQRPIAVDYLNIGRGPKVVTLGILDRQDDRAILHGVVWRRPSRDV